MGLLYPPLLKMVLTRTSGILVWYSQYSVDKSRCRDTMLSFHPYRGGCVLLLENPLEHRVAEERKEEAVKNLTNFLSFTA